jgi:hypothetical protein
MQRVDVYSFYTLATNLHPLAEFKSDAKYVLKDIFWRLFTAKKWLASVLAGELGVPLAICRPAGLELYSAITRIVPDDLAGVDFTREIDYWDDQLYGIVDATRRFETVLSAELRAADTYFVSQKRIYDTPMLIEKAESLFSDAVKARLPIQANVDIRQAGRCLAFECPTAAGFHILRAVEAVLRVYYKEITGIEPKGKLRNWGAYIKRLEQAGGEKKILGILDQIRDLHRNPIFHPEDNLLTEEATTLLGIAQSAIEAMILDMQERQSQTAPLPGV